MAGLKLCKFFLFALLASSTLAAVSNREDSHWGCKHKHFTDKAETLTVEERPLKNKVRGRSMQTTTYPNIRITTDYTNLVLGGTEFINYIKLELVPLIVNFFQASLAVKQPLTSPLKLPSSYSSICSFAVPSALSTGVNTDLYLLVSSQNDSSSNWVASAGSCYLASGSKRPVVAKMLFNLFYTFPSYGDPLLHEKNMYLTLHEMIHALGFTWSNFANFIDSDGVTLKNQIKYAVIDGQNRTILNVEPLTSMLRTHYGCSTLLGAYLEDDGGSGTALTHFERRHFLYEAMTSGVIQGLRLSKFSFAALEGSGWYAPNYTYADPFYVGQGEGCSFLTTACSSSTILNFDEYCTGSGRGCGHVGVSGGVCTSDGNSDGCTYYIPVAQYHCQNPNATSYARFASKEVYDRDGGSQCFSGNLSTSKTASQTSLCLTFTCTGSGLSTVLTLNFGTTKLTCSKQGPISVSGYYGQINCPDPVSYCSTVGQKYCPRNCMARGTCVNNVCVCNAGWEGIDCAMKS